MEGDSRRRETASSPLSGEWTADHAPRWVPPGKLGPWLVVSVALLLCPGMDARAEPDPIAKAVQQELADRGLDPGAIDGAIGWRTRGAIRLFQRSVGLIDTGRIDGATLAALGIRPPGPDTVAPSADSAGVMPEADAETSTAEALRPRSQPEPEAESSRTDSSRIQVAQETQTGTTQPGSPPARRLSFATLGWHNPQTGPEALARFKSSGAPAELKRGTDPMVVPAGDLILVLQEGERIPGLDCDPGAARLSIEFVFGPDGPVIFTPLDGGGFCQAGIGIALAVGSRLAMRRLDWGDTQYPQGTVHITASGLEYAR